MADFWKGFGQGFAPAFEGSYDRARSRREKREDREYAKKQRQDEIDRLAQIAKEDRIADVLGYEGAGVDVRGIPAVRGQLPGPWSRENMAEEQPFGPLEEGVERRVGMPERPTRGALEVLDRPELRGAAQAAKFRRENKLTREMREYEKDKTRQAAELAHNKFMSTAAAKAAVGRGALAAANGLGPEANKETNPISSFAWDEGYLKAKTTSTILEDTRTYAQNEYNRQAGATSSASYWLALGARSVYQSEGSQTPPAKPSRNWDNYQKGRIDEQNKPDLDKALTLAAFEQAELNVKGAFLEPIHKIYEKTHKGQDVPDFRLANWASAERTLADYRELDFLQKQYERVFLNPKLAKQAGVEGYKSLKQSMEEPEMNIADRDLFTNPKELELALRRIYGTYDAKMERLLNRKDVPYEFWNVLGPNGQFLHRTWRIKNNFNASDMTEELVNEANAALAYEASTVMDKAGKEVPIRETRPVPVNEIIRIREAQKKAEKKRGKPLDEAERDLHSIPEPLPQLPGAGELKGPEAPKKPTLGGLPENPEEGVKYTLKQGDDKAEVMIMGGKWFTLKGGKWVPLPR